MNKGSAIASILVAFVGGLLIGHLTGGKSGNDVAEEAVTVGVDDNVERLKVPVSDDQPMKGVKDALVTIVEFSDFQCPFCSRVNPTMARILKEYDGKVRILWRHSPLPFHKDAPLAHQASIEAFKQGGSKKFWAMHDKLFGDQKSLGRETLEKHAKALALDMGAFKKALDSNAHMGVIQADLQIASKIGARGTPGFFINGRKLAGAQPFEKFKEVIDEEIAAAEGLLKKGVKRQQLYAAFMKNAKEKAEDPKPQQPQQARAQPDPNAVYKVPVDGNPSKGPADALVTIVEVSDFECPFCSRVQPTMKQIKEQYGNDVRFVWFNNPLPFHKNAGPAHQTAMEAFDQGGNDKFWAMHDKLFDNRTALSRADLEKYGQELGLNVAQLKSAIDNNEHQAAIEKDQKLAAQLGARGTPSFFINGRNLRGAQPFEAFKKVIDEELAKAHKLVAAGTPRSKVYEESIKNGATSPQTIGGGNAEAPARPDPNKIYNIAVTDDSPSYGPKNAKVVIQEFSDFECPFCGRVNPTIQQIKQEYAGKVRIVWRHFPLPFHQNAQLAHEASMEVHRQGGDEKFWAYHDKLFANQRALSRANLEQYAQEVGGINMAQFKSALDSHRHAARINQDKQAVTKAGAQIGTPSFFINGKLLQGAQPFPAFKAAIDAALAN